MTKNIKTYLICILCILALLMFFRLKRSTEGMTSADEQFYREMLAKAKPLPLPPLAPLPPGAAATDTFALGAAGGFLNTQNWNIRKIRLENQVEIIKDPIAKAFVMRYYFNKGKTGGESGPAIFARPGPGNIWPAEEATVSFKVRFPPGFDFVQGGKIMGLAFGERQEDHASGGDWKPNGGSMRFMWQKGEVGQAIVKGYVYHAIKKHPGKSWPESAYEKQGPDTRRAMDVAKNGRTGNSMWYQKSLAPHSMLPKMKITAGIWHELKMIVKMNDPRSSTPNGKLFMSCTPEGGKAVECEVGDIYYRDSTKYKIQEIYLTTIFGGDDPKDFAPRGDPKKLYAEFKDFSFASS